mgnify:CR=1 FL=1|jgi:hypothetical protein
MARSFKLREIRSIVSNNKIHKSIDEDAYFRTPTTPGDYDWVPLPQLRKRGQCKYKNESTYLKHVDKMISKHGPDAIFDAPSYNEGYKDEDYTDQPTNKGGDDDTRQLKGEGKGLSFGGSSFHSQLTDRKGNGASYTNPSCGVPRMSGNLNGNGFTGSNTGSALSAPLGRAGYSRTPTMRGENNYGPSSDGGSRQTVNSNIVGKKVGVGTRLDANGRDAYHPANVDIKGLKTTPLLEAVPGQNPNQYNDWEDGRSDWGMYPHPTYSTSFSAYVKRPKYKLPPMLSSFAGVLSKALPWNSGVIDNTKMDDGDFSTENRFGNGNPGGFVDEAFAALHSKGLRAQARSIQSRMEMIFRMNEVGVGQEDTPRLNAVALIKEIVGKSMRMSKTYKEERGAGLKIIMVDISPSCAAIRDACYAAALAIADSDSDVVVFTHFNGYTSGTQSKIIGNRFREVPPILDDGDTTAFEAFLATGKLAGAIAFGDADAAKLYGLIAKYAPLVWMTPFDKDDCVYSIKNTHGRDYCFDKASLYIVPDVKDGRSAVKGMEAVLKAKKV